MCYTISNSKADYSSGNQDDPPQGNGDHMSFIRSVYRLIDSFVKKINDNQVGAFSAQATFFIILSFFPFIMFLLTLLQYIPIPEAALFDLMEIVFPDAIRGFVSSLVDEVINNASGTILSVTILSVLWASSKGILAIIGGLNSIYDIKESRNYFFVRFLSILYTVLFAISIIMLLGIFVFGNQIALWLGTKFPVINNLALLIISVRTIVGICILTLFFLFLYRFLPNRKTNFLRELPGAVISSCGWVGFSLVFSFYIDNLSNMTATYGSLTTVVLCMLWLYICMIIMFVGAEINSVLANPAVKNALRRIIFPKKYRSAHPETSGKN